MTAVRLLLRRGLHPARVVGKWLCPCVVCLVVSSVLAAPGPTVHWQFSSAMPPGAIGNLRLGRGGPVSGYFQPVEIRAPNGAQVATVGGGRFEGADEIVRAGMLIGPVYRLRVTDIANHEGREVYPTVEIIDRLYPPAGEAERFAIPIHLSQDELDLALGGRFVTRVIYLEDPDRAVDVTTDTSTNRWFDAPAGYNPLEIADQLGRPVAILRLGSRVPESSEPNAPFVYDSPPVKQ